MKCVNAAGEFPNRLMWRCAGVAVCWGGDVLGWRCAGVAVDEHDMISVGGQQNFKIVLLQS